MATTEERRRILQTAAAQHVASGWTLLSHFDESAVVQWKRGRLDVRRTITVDEHGGVLYQDPGQPARPVADVEAAAHLQASGSTSRARRWMGAAVVITAVLMLAVLAMLFPDGRPRTAAEELDARDRLENRAIAEYEHRIPGVMLKQERCAVQRTFYSGWNPASATAMWSVSCERGRSFMVSVETSTGTVRTLDCRTFEATTRSRCFEPIPTQARP